MGTTPDESTAFVISVIRPPGQFRPAVGPRASARPAPTMPKPTRGVAWGCPSPASRTYHAGVCGRGGATLLPSLTSLDLRELAMCDTGHAHHHPSESGFLVDTPQVRLLIEAARRQIERPADAADAAERIEALKPA